jgi:hypothetical protein
MKTILTYLLFATFLFSNYSCKDNNLAPEADFEGITETNEMGPEPIGRVDTDDWKLMTPIIPDTNHTGPIISIPAYTNLSPAYPNPAINAFMLALTLAREDSVVIYINSSKTKTVKTLVNGRLSAGAFVYKVDVSDFNAGIYRVFCYVYENKKILSTYGDVQVNK